MHVVRSRREGVRKGEMRQILDWVIVKIATV